MARNVRHNKVLRRKLRDLSINYELTQNETYTEVHNARVRSVKLFITT